MSNIHIFGIIPPPYGGISIYNQRLAESLNQKGVNFDFYQSNINDSKRYLQISFKRFICKNINFKKRILHLSGVTGSFNIIVLLLLKFIFRKKIIVTIHNDRFAEDFRKLDLVSRAITWFFFKNIFQLIAVNPSTDFLFLKKSKISVIPAFIPPAPDETDIKQLPGIFNQIRKTHKFLITANAFKISFFNNEDLYGIDLSIELMKKLVKNGYKDIGFIYVIPDIGDYDYYQKMQNLIKQYNLEDYFHFYTKPVAYPAVINMCDLFIRPTNTDGDALSIREAISLKKPAIASNVCKRPEGTILFENRNIDDLYSKTIRVIDNYDEEKKKIENIEFEDNAEKILEVYRKVLNGK